MSFGRMLSAEWPVLMGCHGVAVYPKTYDPSFALACCIWALVTASTLCIIFPLIAPAVALLLLLSLVGTSSTILSRPMRC